MNKKLLYYLYVTPDFFERITNLVNVECLREYAHIFDEAVIYLSLDDVNDIETIKKVEHLFLDLGFNGNITFKIHQNDSYRESAIVKSEIADKLYETEGLIFFGHGKGFTNLDRGYDKISMLHWIVGNYYLSLEFAQEGVDLITGMNTFCTYGSFPLVLHREQPYANDLLGKSELYLGRIKYNWCFSGTFFWLNPGKLYDHLAIFHQEIPRIFDRYYSEKFLGNVMSYECNATGHNLIYLWPNNNMYDDGVAEDCIRFILHDEESMRKYYDFFNNILERVKEKYGVE